MKRAALWALTGALVGLALAGDDPMLLIFPLWLAVVLLREPLRAALARLPGTSGFWLSGVAFGMLIEALAVWNNLDVPPAERILLHPDPARDLLMGVFYYGLLMAVWWWLLGRAAFTGWQVFWVSGVFGIATEEVGGVLLRALTQPLTGIPYALLVAVVYGLFPYLAWLLTADRFSASRPAAGWGWCAAALLALLVQWAVYGNTIYRWILVSFSSLLC